MTDIEQLLQQIRNFRDAREWQQFHNSKDLAVALSMEVSELLELFLWKGTEEAEGTGKNTYSRSNRGAYSFQHSLQ